MERRFIIFAVFATVAQSFLLQSSSVNRAEIEDADFAIIQSGQETTLANFDTAFNGIFDIILKFANVRGCLGNQHKTKKLLSTTEVINNKVFDAFSAAHVATLAAIAIVQPNPSADTTDWEAESVKVEQVVNGTYAAILLSTNSCGSLDKIEKIEYEVTNKMVNIFTTLYNSIRSGRSNQPDVINAIEGARAKAVSSIRTAYSAIFSTIKVLFDAYSSEIPTRSADVFSATKFARSLVASVTKDEVRNKYALIRILFIFSLVDETGILTDFSTIQSNERDLRTGYETAFNPIFRILFKLTGTEDISAEIEAARASVFSGLKTTYNSFINVFQIIQINSSVRITIDQNLADAGLHEIVDGILHAIVEAESTNCPANLGEIEATEERVVSTSLNLYAGLRELILNISISQDDVVAAIENVQVIVLSDIDSAFRSIFGVIKIIAAENCSKTQCRNGSVSVAIETARSMLFYGLFDQTALNFALFRNLYILNSLNNNGIMVDFSVSVIA